MNRLITNARARRRAIDGARDGDKSPNYERVLVVAPLMAHVTAINRLTTNARVCSCAIDDVQPQTVHG
jgi:hypothetical protein